MDDKSGEKWFLSTRNGNEWQITWEITTNLDKSRKMQWPV